jgi:LPS-assembly lipoprotein
MSSPERHAPRLAGRVTLVALLSLAGLQACTVRPLYMNAPMSPASGQSVTADLSQIGIKPVTTRQAQEVRNHLIFLFTGGQGEPAEPRYTLDIGVTRISESAALVQVGTENEPTAAMVTMRSNYRLMTSQGDVVASGTRQFVSSYDVPRQEFAALRAKRDAENRAARELAELIRLAVAQDLTRLPPQ